MQEKRSTTHILKGMQVPTIVTIISHETIVQGNMIVKDGGMRIDGTIDAALVQAQGVIVGTTGQVKANIQADVVVIAGRVEGNVVAKQRLDIVGTAEVYGDIMAPRIAIAEGVLFDGRCKMKQ